MRNPRTNRATAADFRAALSAYPAVDFIAGHCIAPQDIDTFKGIAQGKGFDTVLTVTVLRNPLARALSDYVHDVSRRGSTLTLAQYLAVEWKQNYLTRFFGDGDLAQAKAALRTIDLVDTAHGNDAQTFLNDKGLTFAAQNTAQSNVFSGTPPPCLAIENGVKVGKYSISQADFDAFQAASGDDLALFDDARDLTPQTGAQVAPTGRVMSERQSRPARQRWFRNFIYKPLFARRFGETALPRNSVSAEHVQLTSASIWSDQPT